MDTGVTMNALLTASNVRRKATTDFMIPLSGERAAGRGDDESYEELWKADDDDNRTNGINETTNKVDGGAEISRKRERTSCENVSTRHLSSHASHVVESPFIFIMSLYFMNW